MRGNGKAAVEARSIATGARVVPNSQLPLNLRVEDSSQLLLNLRVEDSSQLLLNLRVEDNSRSGISACFCLAAGGNKCGVVSDRTIRLGVLGSGKGSNMVAIAEASAIPRCPFEIAIVLSDVAEAGILQRSRERAIPTGLISPGKFRTKLDDEAERDLIAALQRAQVDLVVLAGFMRILKGEFLRAFEGRVINIHPSLLPSFPGLEAWKQALDYGVKVTGCTVHLVDQGVDTGPIIAQETVPVLDSDTPATLHERIQQAERVLYPSTLAALAKGEITVQGRRCVGFRRIQLEL